MITEHTLSVLRYYIAYQTPCYVPYVIICEVKCLYWKDAKESI